MATRDLSLTFFRHRSEAVPRKRTAHAQQSDTRPLMADESAAYDASPLADMPPFYVERVNEVQRIIDDIKHHRMDSACICF